MSGDTVVAESGSQVYGQVVSSAEIGRGIVAQHSDLLAEPTTAVTPYHWISRKNR